MGDSAGYVHHLDQAIADGDGWACRAKVWFAGDPINLTTSIGIVHYLDQVLTCPAPETTEHARQTLQPLAENVRAEMPEALTTLDSLRADGFFERHPQFAALFDAP